MITILKTLQLADYNLDVNRWYGNSEEIGKKQLHDAVVLLSKGYSLDDEIDDLIEKYNPIESAPEKPFGAIIEKIEYDK